MIGMTVWRNSSIIFYLGLVFLSSCILSQAWEQPNFIVVLTDDQGYNDLGVYGSPDIRTPVLDRMAQEAIRFTSFYAQPVCGPSRAALLTGSCPVRVAEPENRKNPNTILHSREVTIAETLKTAGYATAVIGKWHMAGDGDEPWDFAPPPQAPGRPGAKSPYASYFYYSLTRLQAVRSGRWKLVLPRQANAPYTSWLGRYTDAVEKPLLFDLQQDLGERFPAHRQGANQRRQYGVAALDKGTPFSAGCALS